MQRPLIPPPTMTQSALTESPASRLGLGFDVEIVDSSAIEQRSLRVRRI